MSAAAVVEGFDVVEDLGAGRAVVDKDAPINQFEFEGGPEAFPGRVVRAVALTAHGGQQTRLGEGVPVSTAGVLHAAIGVEAQAVGRLPMAPRPAQGLQDPGGVDALTHGPADDLAAEEIEAGRQEKPARLGFNKGAVGPPAPVGGCGLGSLGQPVH